MAKNRDEESCVAVIIRRQWEEKGEKIQEANRTEEVGREQLYVRSYQGEHRSFCLSLRVIVPLRIARS